MQNTILPTFLSKMNIARQGHFVSLKIEYTILAFKLLKMFDEIGIIRGFHVLPFENKIKVMLRYKGKSLGVFDKIVQISKSQRRVYVDVIHLLKLKNETTGIYIISTSKGLMFDSECVRLGIGGEVLLLIT